MITPSRDVLNDLRDVGLEPVPSSPNIDTLARILFRAQEEIDPIEQRMWEELTPFEHEFYRYPVRALLREHDSIVKTLEEISVS